MGGNDEICAICGLTPAVITAFKQDFFHSHKKWRFQEHEAETVALAEPSIEGGPPTWCPIDVQAYRAFHNNLAVVGHFNGTSYYDDDYSKHTDPADWPDLLKSEAVSLICRLEHRAGGPLEHAFASKKHQALRVPGGEADTSSLDSLDDANERGWPSAQGHAWEVQFSDRALMVHVPCWELLQGVVQWRTQSVGPTPAMTPLRYWRTEYLAGLAKAKERQRRDTAGFYYGLRARQVQDPSPKRWRHFDIVEEFVKHGFCDAFIFLHEATAHYGDFEPHVAAAINDSIDGKGIDSARREEVWERLPAWVWQPPYLFEVEHGFTCVNHTSLPAVSSLSFGRLPTEILLAISSFLDLTEVIALAATCRAMTWQCAQSLDEAAKRKMNESYPWMLPYTKRERDAWERSLVQTKEARKNSHFSCFVYLKNSIRTTTGFARNRKRIWGLAKSVVDMSLRIDAEGTHNLFRE